MNADPERSSPVAVVPARSPVVDVIVPVYAGMEETRRCLESVLTFPQRTAQEIVVIDDCGPEPAISAWLDNLADSGAITLLKNPINMGFVNAANRGMVLHPDRDVVLLNSDAEVHGDWLDRLHRHAASDPLIGSVTPFSNNATLCSYPRFMQDNPLPEDWPLAALDDLFAEANAGRSVEIPTAVGFCMYITRRCLEQVGYFDAVAFKRGYGEENDFSMRAREVGFRHLLAADVFVYHRGGVSFGAESQPLCAEAQRTLEQRHPYYPTLIRDFCANDPGRILRRRVDACRLKRSKRRKMLFITHALGGGTEKHVRDLAGLLAADFEVLVLRPTCPTGVSIEWGVSGEEFIVYYTMPYEYEELLDFAKKLNFCHIHIHHCLGLNQQILRLPQDLRIPYDLTLHDYYFICPQYNLADREGRYCGEPDVIGCNACLAERPAPWGLDILSWRGLFRPLLANAARVIAPSRDVLKRMRRYVPEACYIELPHPGLLTRASIALSPCNRTGRLLKILVLGGLTPAKGLHFLEACAADAKQRDLPLFFRVVGYINGPPIQQEPEIPLSFSGPYDDGQLPLLIELERPDVIFFPAKWPETYSYTLNFAMQTGLPIITPHLGAFCERLARYPLAWLLDWDSSAQHYNDFFVSLLGKNLLVPRNFQQDNLLSPDNFLKVYLGISLKNESFSAKKEFTISDISFSEKHCHLVNCEMENDIDSLSRTELIQLIRMFSIDNSDQQITKKQVLDHMEKLRADLAKKEREIEELSDWVARHDVEEKQLRREILELQHVIKGIYVSNSWKITKPFRWIKDNGLFNYRKSLIDFLFHLK